jgi:hypothetical protein
MPVRGQRQVRKYRGTLRALMRDSAINLERILNRDTTKPFLTNVQRAELNAADTVLVTLLAEKVGV